MTVIETRGTLGDDFTTGVTAKLHDIISQIEENYSLAKDTALGIDNNDGSGLMKNESSTEGRLTINGITALGKLRETAEGQDYAMDSRSSTYKTQVEWYKDTNGITITEEDRDD